MGTHVGIDGFRWGWVAAWIDDRGRHGFDFSPSLERLLSYPHNMAMIDVPIGLPTHGYRVCDREARDLIGAPVFLGARRGFWAFNGHADANRHFHARKEPGISMQLWHLRSKIKQVDGLMTPERQQKLRETHPELVFWRLNGNAPLRPKKTREGVSQRISLLREQGFTEADRWMSYRHETGIRRDDLLDACASAVAARDVEHRIPRCEPPKDCRGLRMEMWY